MSSSPANIRSAVVLPQPDGPTRTMNSPSDTWSESSSTARMSSPKILVTPSKVISAISACSSVGPLLPRSSVDAHGQALDEIALEGEVNEHCRKGADEGAGHEGRDRRRSSGRQYRESDGDRSIGRVLDEEESDQKVVPDLDELQHRDRRDCRHR